MAIIEARELVKSYGPLRAVDGIGFDVEQGECFGFLGPNGAGKTSTTRMIYCASPVTSGQLIVAGHDVTHQPRQVKALIGVVPQENNLDLDLRVRQNLLVYARYFDIPSDVAIKRADSALDLLQLTEKAEAKVDELSGGMKRRLIISRALINEPRVLIMDEPTTGLDPQARHLVWQKLRLLRGQGVTMVLTTHYMDEAAQLCDRLVIMDRGKILREGAPQALVEQELGCDVLELRVDPAHRQEIEERLAATGRRVEATEDIIYVFGRRGEPLRELAARLDGDVRSVTQRSASLEDLFLSLTGRGLEE